MSKEAIQSKYQNLVSSSSDELSTIDNAIKQIQEMKSVIGDLGAEVEDIATTIYKVAGHIKRASATLEVMEGNLESKRYKLTGIKEPVSKSVITNVKTESKEKIIQPVKQSVKTERQVRPPKSVPVISDKYTPEEKELILKISNYIKNGIQSFWAQSNLSKPLNISNVYKVLENISELYDKKLKIFNRVKIPIHHGLIIHILIDQCGGDDAKTQLNYNHPDAWKKFYSQYKEILVELDMIFKM